jgi:hypothetical protein
MELLFIKTIQSILEDELVGKHLISCGDEEVDKTISSVCCHDSYDNEITLTFTDHSILFIWEDKQLVYDNDHTV